MRLMDIKFSEVPKFGICRFTNTDRGWTFQYDKELICRLDEICDAQLELEGYDEPPYFIEEPKPTGQYVPELSDDSVELGVFRFFDTYEEAYDSASDQLTQMSALGLIARYL